MHLLFIVYLCINCSGEQNLEHFALLSVLLLGHFQTYKLQYNFVDIGEGGMVKYVTIRR